MRIVPMTAMMMTMLALLVGLAMLLLSGNAIADATGTVVAGRPTSANCTENFFTQNIDHFNWAKPLNDKFTYRQRYFICDQYADLSNPKTPIFFYFGNEDDVTLYVNNTGLMWENAASYKALLVFAEHRYYGKSKPFPAGTPGCMNWLTTEQAMADYATLIRDLKQDLNLTPAPVIGFGGSYGGMLAAYFRRKYPDIVDGVIAGSAPIWAFSGLTPAYDYYGFNNIIADDASSKGGASDHCRNNFKAIQPRIMAIASTQHGRHMLSQQLRLCKPLASDQDAYNILLWAQNAWAYMAMGDFPYASGYIVHGRGKLPPYPVREACKPLSDPQLPANDTKFISALRDAMDVYYNYTHTEPCFDLFPATSIPRLGHHPHHLLSRPRPAAAVAAAQCTGDWGYQFCTEMVMPSSQGGPKDMFWPALPFDLNETIKQCQQQWGVTPRPLWAPLNLASKDLTDVSNMVLSNGGLDPWRAGGVVTNVSDSVVAVVIESGAHHIDLMFSDPADPPDVIAARRLELQHISRWINQHNQQ
ncbi:hypothetical protein PTSG_04239 [Salpingoeca rosetta]|uniref:Lysosomal Pro-X carboxypeptidase n=1 Tax=Salpingoeca rosetta (strain ATCC 50818 / BSB-021) TaxID=946362 RepID=F2U6Z9_SALR5|nr:uncharacterized protein PTSG_04239 [Salpingoeca rosetta]EGD83631.1 hypothetical protein PTSG_04239 [Salpingoeca rosetta]|eukprot:XP_004995135.1 hypothetical protein PTSG_04239 [Salpingoeca rosetta]